MGGLSIRKVQDMNKALLAKLHWRLIIEQFMGSHIKQKYIALKNFCALKLRLTTEPRSSGRV